MARGAVIFTTFAAALFAAAATAEPGTSRELAPRTELNLIPFIGGDSDVGIGIGFVGDLARLQPEYDPFRWRLEAASFISFKSGDARGGGIRVPFQDYYLLLSVPQLTSSGRLRFEIRPSFTDESTQRYLGIGNASPPLPEGVPLTVEEYERRHAALLVAARWGLGSHFYLRPQVDYTYTWVTLKPGSILAQQRVAGEPFVRSLLDGPLHHGLPGLELRLEYDSRDNEIVTRHGAFHHLRFRFSPRLGPAHPFQFVQMNATARVYTSPLRWLSFSARLVGDAIVGDAPFYELTRVEDSSVVGGGKGIRGVPGQRYYGKIKVFGNLEGHARVWSLAVRGKPFVLSTAVFADGGRVWTDFGRHPELDGTGLGLKYGLGTGLRLQEGTTFVVRADIAWSPDAEPVGAYFNAGQMF
jgi:hypothetical protein